ncbi:MAG: SpoIID/LytB domain-containing protein [Gemmatimonadales bacterium]
MTLVPRGRRAVFILSAVAVACSPKRVREDDQPPAMFSIPRTAAESAKAPPQPAQPEMPRDEAPPQRVEGARDVRVALATAAQGAVLSGSGAFRVFDARNTVLVRARNPDAWSVERRGRQLRAVRQGTATSWSDGLLTLRPDRDDEFVVFAGQRFRGVIRVVASDTGIVVVNVLPLEWYLRGVVPLEIGGPRAGNEDAAAEAQAIAARSYTVVRLAAIDGGSSRNASFDLLSGVADQVYGGADAERPFSNQAVARTVGLVLRYGGRVVSAPYHSTCGGETAAPDEVWRAGNEPFLQRVSDRIPGTADRFYCDISPRFSWTRSFTAAELDASVAAYLAGYTSVPPGGAGHVRGAAVESRTASGRVARLVVEAERGNFALRGNDIRYVLRAPGGEILNSTYFSVQAESRRDGGLARLVVKGNGYGHGVGMCQWGAIGRARAGQSARTILATYYPGTTVGLMN